MFLQSSVSVVFEIKCIVLRMIRIKFICQKSCPGRWHYCHRNKSFTAVAVHLYKIDTFHIPVTTNFISTVTIAPLDMDHISIVIYNQFNCIFSHLTIINLRNTGQADIEICAKMRQITSRDIFGHAPTLGTSLRLQISGN